MAITYCMHCATRLERHDETCYECENGHRYFNNPRAGTSIVVIRDGNVLLVKRRSEPAEGKYCFPGGFVDYGESPYDAARREMAEETNVKLGRLELLEVQTMPYGEDETSCSIVFLAKEWDGEFKAGDDAAGLSWKPLDFIESDGFAWHYPGLLDKLKAIDQPKQ